MQAAKTEYSDSTATPDKQDKLEFLKEKSKSVNDQIEQLRKNLIHYNDEKLLAFCASSEEQKLIKQKKVQTKLQSIIENAKKTSLAKRIGKRVVEDPREGRTRRYTNYIPIPRYQFVKRIKGRK